MVVLFVVLGNSVTILILVETPLQSHSSVLQDQPDCRHNPYFSGNSFAILLHQEKTPASRGHNPYFSENSFAIERIWTRMEQTLWSQSLF